MHDLTRFSARALELDFEANKSNLPALRRLHAELLRRRSRQARALEVRVSARITELESRHAAALSRRTEDTIVVLSGVLSRSFVTISGELRLTPDSVDQKTVFWKLRAIRPDGEVIEKSEHLRSRNARNLLDDMRLFLLAADVRLPLSVIVSKIAECDEGFAQQLEAAIADVGLSAAEPYPSKASPQRPWWLFPQETLAGLTGE